MLNRIKRWLRSCWQIEADPRHCELVIEQLGLHGSKGLSAPGSDDDETDEGDSAELLTGADVTLLRGLAARYLSV